MVLYFDESHTLMESPYTRTTLEEDACSGYQILCSVMNYFLHLSLFYINISATFSLSRYSPTKTYGSSARIMKGKDDPVQAPFVELPFDMWSDDILAREDTHTLEEVCKPKFMVRFGRPL